VIFALAQVQVTVLVNCFQGFVQCSQLVSDPLIFDIKGVSLISDYSVGFVEILCEDLDSSFDFGLELILLLFVLCI
jgi:hypothetical protein